MDLQELTIAVEGLELRFSQTEFGPTPIRVDGPLHPLPILLMYLVGGDLPGFVEAVERRESVYHTPVGAHPAEDPEEVREAAETWRELTGRELGTDVYEVTTRWHRGLLMPRAVLIELARTLLEMRAAAPKPPGPWLFMTPVARNHDPAPGEEEVMRLVEEHAAELDQLAARATDLEARATVAARRRFLLQELAGYGLLTFQSGHHRATWLERWKLPVLLGYQRATLGIEKYWRQYTRGTYMHGNEVAYRQGANHTVQGAAVSLDWVRIGVATPAGWDAYGWLAFCERAVWEARLGDVYEGEIEVERAGFRALVAWRRDDGTTPAVVSGRLLGYRVAGSFVLEAGGLVLGLEPTLLGPVPARYLGPLLPLTTLLRHVADGVVPGFAEAVERREVVKHLGIEAHPADAGTDLAEAAEAWRTLTGRELGTDVYELKLYSDKRLLLPRLVLAELVRALLAMRAATPRPPGPWLFLAAPLHDEPAPGEEATMRAVEVRAAELDDLPARSADRAPKRRALLAELASHGILSLEHGEARAQWLERWKLPVLRGYQVATNRIGQYWRSDARKARVGDGVPAGVLGGAVSLDWFRHGDGGGPPGWTADDWLAFCERSLADADVGDGDQGELYLHQGTFRGVIAWRRDDGVHPAVVSARLR